MASVPVPTQPNSRLETYYAKIAGQPVDLPEYPITREEAYLDEIAKNGGGGGGGTTNYNQLSNKPQIGGVELKGNKTLDDLGAASTTQLASKVDKVEGKELSENDYTDADKAIVDGVTSGLNGKVDKVNGKGLSTNDFDATEKEKLDGLADIRSIGSGLNLNASTGELTASGIDVPVDDEMSDDSVNPVQNKVITAALAGKVDTNGTDRLMTAAEGTKLSGIEAEANKTVVDQSITDGGTNPVEGGAIYTALAGKVNTNGTDSLMTAEEHTKLSGVAAGAQVNTIEGVTLNGTAVTPDANKIVALTVITKAVDDLTNYYTKTQTYTKTEVDNLIAAITTLDIQAVETLPTENISTTTIYLVPKSPAQTQNAKDEYINTTGTTAGWEKIGDTEIDLSGYVTTSALNTALADYTTTTDLTTLLAGKISKVTGATNGNFAGLNASGEVTDSGKSASDFASPTDIQDRIKETVGWTGRNLYNKATGKANTIVTATGESTSSTYSSYNASDYIEVEANTQYYLQNVCGQTTQHTCCIYDSSKAFLRYAEIPGTELQSGVINTGNDAKYIRLNVRTSAVDICMVSKGSNTNVPYEAYHKTVESAKADKITPAAAGNFASLDANGNLADSGKKATDFSQVTTTTTDPGAGSALATNSFLVVIEE